MTSISAAASLSDVSKLVAAVAWPLVAIAAILWLRRPLSALTERVARNLKKLSIGSVSIELSEEGSAANPGLAVIAEFTSPLELGQSNMPTLAMELAKPEPLPYAVIDLGRGKRWLSSRLYLFVVLLRRTRDLGTVVFLETRDGVAGRFVGLADVEALEGALTKVQPWLEIQMTAAYNEAFVPYAESGVIGPEQAGWIGQQVASEFVKRLQEPAPQPPPDSEEPAQTTRRDWTLIRSKQGPTMLEHAAWLSGPELQRLIGDALDPFAFIVEDTPADAAARTRAILGLANRDHVVVVDGERRFKRTLIKRREALEQLATQAADGPEPAMAADQ